jgi:hypothetical protein
MTLREKRLFGVYSNAFFFRVISVWSPFPLYSRLSSCLEVSRV